MRYRRREDTKTLPIKIYSSQLLKPRQKSIVYLRHTTERLLYKKHSSSHLEHLLPAPAYFRYSFAHSD